ncbi:ABC transporter permease [Pseudonocardiaceae bacterium YIM PH 21723]|nr:ABC transporter permease [Pseudonocardiaceae bacterium YIM PH 21723]
MGGYLLRRGVVGLALAFCAVFLTYCLTALTFDPLAALRSRTPPVPPSVIAAKSAELHLDQPVPQRFLTWFLAVVHGDLGRTNSGTAIDAEILDRIGVSLRLFVLGSAIGILLGILVGVLGATRQYRFSDHVGTLVSFVLLSTPVFLSATLLKYAAIELNQAVGHNVLLFTGEYEPTVSGGFWPHAVDRLQHLVLPTLSIAAAQIALYSRYQRNAMLDVLGSDFLRTAAAKGLTRNQAIRRHGLRVAVLPIVTMLVFSSGLMIVGGVITESVFTWNGMGRWLIDGIATQDTTIVTTVTLFVAVVVLLCGTVSDLLYAALDPRVREVR